MKLSYVIPLLNEAQSIRTLYQEIITNNPETDFEIIFIDDGSKDISYKILSELAAEDKRVKLVRFRRNFGKAAALQTGFKLAQGELIFTLDADLQDDPAEIPNFITKMDSGYDLVSGWKKRDMTRFIKRCPPSSSIS